MLSRLTGGLRPWQLSLEGKLHETQPPASVGVAAQAIGQNGRPLVEPGAFFVDGSYALRINSWNSLVGCAVTVRMRFLGSDGRLRDNEWMHTPNTNRTKATTDFPLGTGFPLNITAFASSGTPLVGQTFVQVQLISGLGGATTLLGTLLQDYVTGAQALAWPGSPIRSSIEGGGFVRLITGTTPAPGAEISETVPTGARWQVLFFRALLNASAAAANRRVLFIGTGSGSTTFGIPPAATQLATQAVAYTWAPNLPIANDGAWFVQNIPIPNETTLLAGQQLQTSTQNIQAADQWQNLAYQVREFLEAAA